MTNLKPCIDMINEIIRVEEVDGVDKLEIPSLIRKTVQHITDFSTELANDGFKHYIYAKESDPDFMAYFAIRGDKVNLVFRQALNDAHHYYFSTPEEILKGVDFVEKKKMNQQIKQRTI